MAADIFFSDLVLHGVAIVVNPYCSLTIQFSLFLRWFNFLPVKRKFLEQFLAWLEIELEVGAKGTLT